MKQKELKVEPAKKIYNPKYPSYFDKNPLLFPETRPYPFNLKFMNWILRGSMAGAVMLGSLPMMGQEDAQDLKNPFPLNRANVPYTPTSFGTGMPERLTSDEALKAIRGAFEKMNIELEEDAWLNEEVGVYVDGYNDKEEIGFILMDHRNMDGSFVNSTWDNSRNDKSKKPHSNTVELQRRINFFKRNMASYFNRFVEDKSKYLKGYAYYTEGPEKEVIEKIRLLDPTPESEKKFEDLYIELQFLLKKREAIKNGNSIQEKIFLLIDERVEDPVVKIALLNRLNLFRMPKSQKGDYFKTLEDRFDLLKETKTDDSLIDEYLDFEKFHTYCISTRRKNDDDFTFQKIKIMDSYPIKKWPSKIATLQSYFEKRQISMTEARQIEKNSKSGKSYVAPISIRDDHMRVKGLFNFTTDRMQELQDERAALYEEFSTANGMTQEVKDRKAKEMRAIQEKYNWSEIRKLPKVQQDSLNSLKSEAMEQHKLKFEAMEKLTKEEKKVYFDKIGELQMKMREEEEVMKDISRQKTMEKLENQVVEYIQWARSQMGS